MSAKSILFLGFGDIAGRTCALLPDQRLVGVARSHKRVSDGVEFWQGAADSLVILAKATNEQFDAAVITLTPTEYSDHAYQVAYVDTVKALVRQWQQGGSPKLILFVSSTSVYHQNDGEWVDELSPVEPTRFSGRRLLEAESCLLESGLPVCILRSPGIYGPGRDFLIRQVRVGSGGNGDYTNRIHADDCAGAIVHLLRRHWSGQALEHIYVVSDSTPSVSKEVRSWLAGRMGIDPDTLHPSDGDPSLGVNRRCSNQRLLATGFKLLYPSYREGYEALLSSASAPRSLPVP